MEATTDGRPNVARAARSGIGFVVVSAVGLAWTAVFTMVAAFGPGSALVILFSWIGAAALCCWAVVSWRSGLREPRAWPRPAQYAGGWLMLVGATILVMLGTA